MLKLIIESYLLAWPFAALHFILLVFVAWESYSAWHKASLLSTGGTPASRIAAAFGPRFSIRNGEAPMLASVVEDLIDRINGHTNLFLLVGIAGTFFGMFGLARVSGAGALELQRTLRESLAHALPVGFVGALLTIAGHLVSSFVAQKLRTAAALTTAEIQAPSQESQLAELVRVLGTAVEAIRTVLTPLAGIEGAIVKSLEPVVNKMVEQFEINQKAHADQLLAIGKSLKGFDATLIKMSESTNQLALIAGGMTEGQRQMLAALSETERVIEERGKELRVVTEAMLAATTGIDKATSGFYEFPGRLNSAMTQTFEAVEKQWKATVNGYVQVVANETVAASGRIATAAETASARLTGAAAQLDNFSANAGERLTRGVDQASERLAAPITAFTDTIRREMPQSIELASAVLDKGLARVSEMHGGLETLITLTATVRQTLDGWDQSRQAMAGISRELRTSTSVLSDATTTLASSARTLADLERSYMTIRWPRRSRSLRQ